MPGVKTAGRIVVLLGAPGVGKGTQGIRLGRELGWAHVSTGDLLRAARRDGSVLGLEARRYMDAGKLVPDGVMVDLVREHLAGLGSGRGVVFDGFPRTVQQAEALDRALAPEREVSAAALLDAPEAVLFKRISGRRSSPGGRVYNVYFDPPRRDGVCDETGEPLIHRTDDQPDTVHTRLAVYREATAPLIGYYEAKGLLVRVDAEGDIDQVYAGLRAAVADRKPAADRAATGS
ncbi:MAG: adenylate kinase [Gemmatimonadota bacterium]|nr:adenylate kinase [Gemmatimonadota bacterium]